MKKFFILLLLLYTATAYSQGGTLYIPGVTSTDSLLTAVNLNNHPRKIYQIDLTKKFVKYSDTASLLITRSKYRTDSTTTSNTLAAQGTMISTLQATAVPVINPAAVTRSLNTNYVVSTTRPFFVMYVDSLIVTNPLIAGNSTADVWLEYSTNSGTTWTIACHNGAVSKVGVAVAIQIIQSQTGVLCAFIPTLGAGGLMRIRSTTSGTAGVYLTPVQQENVF